MVVEVKVAAPREAVVREVAKEVVALEAKPVGKLLLAKNLPKLKNLQSLSLLLSKKLWKREKKSPSLQTPKSNLKS